MPSTHRPLLQACAGGTGAFRSRAAITYTAGELTLADRPPATPAAMLFPDSRGSAEAESDKKQHFEHFEHMIKFITANIYKATKTGKKKKKKKTSFILPRRGKSSQGTESLGKTKSDECGLLVD